MRVIAVSDLHGYLPDPESIPACDVVCICGDIVPLEYQNDDAASIAWFCLEFVPWSDELDCKKVIFIAGNHDFFLEHIMLGPVREDGTRKCRTASEVLRKLLPGNNKGKHKLVYLRDSSFELEGKRFYGTPWISGLPRWAFNQEEDELRTGNYAHIPHRCDVLLTHMPPALGDAGTVLQYSAFNYLADYSSKALADVLLERDIRYTFCGHVHTGGHVIADYGDGTVERKIVNVSVKDEDYRVQTYYFPVYEI